MASRDVDVDVECRSCDATGLYLGSADPEGVATVCSSCKGTGGVTITCRPFRGRRACEGVDGVLPSHGVGNSMTYEEFLLKYTPLTR